MHACTHSAQAFVLCYCATVCRMCESMCECAPTMHIHTQALAVQGHGCFVSETRAFVSGTESGQICHAYTYTHTHNLTDIRCSTTSNSSPNSNQERFHFLLHLVYSQSVCFILIHFVYIVLYMICVFLECPMIDLCAAA